MLMGQFRRRFAAKLPHDHEKAGADSCPNHKIRCEHEPVTEPLSASEDATPFYAARGWQRWRGRSYAFTPNGIVRTADEDDGIYVLPSVPVDLAGAITCDWRDGDVW
jgi:hypothetical protein